MFTLDNQIGCMYTGVRSVCSEMTVANPFYIMIYDYMIILSYDIGVLYVYAFY